MSIVVLMAMPALSPASSFTLSGTASTSGQSMWSAGSSYTLNYSGSAGTGILSGSSGDLGPGGGCVNLYVSNVCAGWDAYVNAAVSLGVNYGFSLNSGSVAASVPVSIGITAPNGPVTAGRNFAVSAGSFTFGNDTLSTTGTSAQAYSNLTYSLAGGAYGDVCAGSSCPDFGSPTNLGNSSGSVSVLSFNQNNSGTLNVLGTNFNPGSISFGNFATGTLNIPSGPDTSGSGNGTITTNLGMSQLAQLDLNVTNILTDLLDLPSLSGSYGADGFGVDYNIFSADLDLGLDLTQQFTFTPTAQLYLEVQQTGQLIALGQNSTDSILFPTGDSSLDITPVIEIGGRLTNDTGLCVDPSISLTGLSGDATFAGIDVGSFGPEFSYDHDLGCYGGTIYSDTFNLGNFSQIDGQTFVVTAATPEPVSALLIVTGLGLIGYLKRTGSKIAGRTRR